MTTKNDSQRRRVRHSQLLLPVLFTCAALGCASTDEGGQAPSAASTSTAGGSQSSGSGDTTKGAGGRSPVTTGSGGAAGNGGSGAGAAMAGSSGSGTGDNGGGSGYREGDGGAGSGGREGDGGGGDAATGDAGIGDGAVVTADGSDASRPSSCPTTLPMLAADGDTSFYANRAERAHGLVKTVQYKAGSQKTMRVYTPPNYDNDTAASYPVLYINHGGGESDVQWACTNANNCGYAGLILDNLLADGKAVPMVIAMPDTGDCANFNPPKPPTYDDPCTTQYVNDFIPYIEKNYRVKVDRNYRAIAGLSMGGLVTMTTGFAHLEIFSHVFIYSSGYMAETRPQWEMNLSGALGDAKGTNRLLNAPIYLAAGNTDTALPNAQAVRDIFKKDGIKVLYQQSTLGHEWANWRRYLAQTLPLMFKNAGGCE